MVSWMSIALATARSEHQHQCQQTSPGADSALEHGAATLPATMYAALI